MWGFYYTDLYILAEFNTFFYMALEEEKNKENQTRLANVTKLQRKSLT